MATSVAGPPPGVTLGAPVPAQASGPPPGVTLAAPVSAPATPDLAANPNGEGTYQMKGPTGTQMGVPYSKVGTAYAGGLNFADGYDGPEQRRFNRDAGADPRNTYQNGLPSRGGAPMNSEIPGVDASTAGDYLKGAVKSAVQVPNTIAGWLDKVASTHGQQAMEKAENTVAPGVTNAPSNFDQGAGGFAEQMAEWLYGQGEARTAYETLSQSQKMQKVAAAAKFIEQHPLLAASLRTAATGTAAATQAGAHGATGEEALAAGAGGAAAAGAGELFAGASKAAAAAETAEEAHAAAPAVLADRTAAMQAERQAVAQGSVKDVVGKGVNDALDRFNAAGAKVPGFVPVQTDAAKLGSFGEGAEQVKAAARPIYQKIDAAKTAGANLADLQAQYDSAMQHFDYKAADTAEMAMDEALAKKPADVHPDEMAAAKMAWRDSKVLDKLHAATEGAFNGIGEDMAAQEGTSDRLLKSGTKDGGTLQLRLGRVMSTPAKAKEVYRVIGQDGVANLYRAAHLVSTPELAKATTALAEQVAQEFPAPASSNLHRVAGGAAGASAGAAVGHAIAGSPGAAAGATLGGAAGAALSDGARMVMRRMVTSPAVGQMMDYAVRNNVTPKLAADIIAKMIRSNQQPQEQAQ